MGLEEMCPRQEKVIAMRAMLIWYFLDSKFKVKKSKIDITTALYTRKLRNILLCIIIR